MEELLYYPSFEVQNENWLKFALLYIDKLKPIVPYSGDKYISEYSKVIYNESDLLESYRPEYSEALKATLDALDILEKILANPQRYSPVFRSSQIDEIWRNPKRYHNTLFRDKYTDELESFMIKNRLGEKSVEGINLSRELAILYMTIFAQAISDSKSLSPITDVSDLDRFSIFVRHRDQTEKEKFIIAQKLFEIKLPEKIERIPIEKILALRKREDFKTKLKAFHKSLKDFLEGDDEGKSAHKFIEKHKYIYNEFNKELLQLGFGLTSFGIGVWITTQSPESNEQEVAKLFLEGGTYALSALAIGKSWKNTKTKRYCKKYLADISKLNVKA
jgi:hypothetical protein